MDPGNPFPANSTTENLLLSTGAKIAHRFADEAFNHPIKDLIRLQIKAQFLRVEELIAEMDDAFLCAYAGSASEYVLLAQQLKLAVLDDSLHERWSLIVTSPLQRFTGPNAN